MSVSGLSSEYTALENIGFRSAALNVNWRLRDATGLMMLVLPATATKISELEKSKLGIKKHMLIKFTPLSHSNAEPDQ